MVCPRYRGRARMTRTYLCSLTEEWPRSQLPEAKQPAASPIVEAKRGALSRDRKMALSGALH